MYRALFLYASASFAIFTGLFFYTHKPRFPYIRKKYIYMENESYLYRKRCPLSCNQISENYFFVSFSTNIEILCGRSDAPKI